MTFDYNFPYPSKRMPIIARNVVATSQPLAAQAGLQMLYKGGNAVDAALAAAITLAVVEPCSNGVGSDAFAILWDGQRLHGLNASGHSPAALTRDVFAGNKSIPVYGWKAVTVPGAVSAWVALSEKFGKLPFADLFAPAIHYAADGYHVSPVIAKQWSSAPNTYKDFPDFAPAFLPGGKAPLPGELFRPVGLANTLNQTAQTRGEAFYKGALARQIAAHAKATGGYITEEDLAAHRADWVEPISIDYRGVRLHEIPPNGQGIAALIAAGILDHLPDVDMRNESADSLHCQIEAMKLAFADVNQHVADPRTMVVSPERLLDSDYLGKQAGRIDKARAQFPKSEIPTRGGTVYLTAADEHGMMVSFIQSNFYGFGSGIVVPGTGIALQNRGYGFTLEKGHPNEVGPRKRPFHTIIPAFVTRDGKPEMSFGVMGGQMQAQGHLQMMVRIFAYGENPQAAADAPRWRVTLDGALAVEPSFPADYAEALKAKGHTIEITDEGFGGAQIIYKLADGYLAASEPRKDGQAVGY